MVQCEFMKRLVVVLILSLATAGCSRYISIKQRLPSPGETYIATLYTDMGGPAAGGWCTWVVSVTPSQLPISKVIERSADYDSEVYKGDCDVKPEMRWLSSKSLQITLPGFMRNALESATFRGMDVSGNVAIVFVFGRKNSVWN